MSKPHGFASHKISILSLCLIFLSIQTSLSQKFSHNATQVISPTELATFTLQPNTYIIRNIAPSTTGALAIQGFLQQSANSTFGKIRLLAGVKTTTLNTTDNSTKSKYTWQKDSCKLSGPYEKCLFTEATQTLNAINMTCVEGPCGFSLKIYHLQAMDIEPKTPSDIIFSSDQLQLVKLSASAEKDDQFSRLIIETRLMNSQPGQTNLTAVQLFPPSKQQQQIKSDSILTVFQNGNDPIKGKPIFALISGVKDGKAQIKAMRYQFSESLTQDDTFVDYFVKNEYSQYISYSLNVDTNENSNQGYAYVKFIFKWFEVKQGEVNLMASCRTLNKNTIDNYWFASFKPSIDGDKQGTDSEVNKQYSLVLSKDTAMKVFSSHTQIYFGLTTGNESGFFKASVQVQKEAYPSIGLNEIVAGKSEGDVINLQLQVPWSDEEYVTVDLRNSGGTANLYLRECKDKFCLAEKYTKTNYQEMNSFSGALEDNYQTQSISFRPSCSGSDGNLGSCYYLIGVIPDIPVQDKTQNDQQGPIAKPFGQTSNSFVNFQVEVFSELSQKRQQLRENQLFESRVLENDYQYFVMYIQNPQNIKQIVARVSSAHVQLYVSVDNRCPEPSPMCQHQKKIKKGLNSDPVVLTGKDTQKGAVFVGVYGYTSTIFSVVVEVERVDQSLITELKSGSLYNGELSVAKKIVYFIFDPSKAIPNTEDNDYDVESLEIHLRASKDKMIIMVNNDGSMPYSQGNGFIWQSTSGVLFIDKTDKNYVKGAVYNIAVMATEHAFDALPTINSLVKSSASLQFELLATVGAVAKIVELGRPIQDQIAPRDEKMYQIHVSADEENLVISHHSPDHKTRDIKVKVFVGSQPFENTTDFEFNYPFSESSKEFNATTISSTLCKEKPSCSIFIGFQSEADSSVIFTLSVWTRKYAIELKEGVQHSEGLNQVDSYVNMYFKPSNREHSLNLYVSSIYGHTGFNAVVWSNKDMLPSIKWPFPTSSQSADLAKYHYVSGIHNGHSITFESFAFQDCWPDCLLLISLSYYQGLPTDGNDHTSATVQNQQDSNRINDRFTVLVSSIYADLNLNQQLEFTLNTNDSKFFYINLVKILDSKDSLLIELTSLSGRASMGVMIKDDVVNRYPGEGIGKESDLVSYSNYLRITNKQIIQLAEKFGIKANQNPQLIVEITCISTSAGRFVVSAMEGNSPVLDLMHGLPQDTSILPGQLRFFKYFHFAQSDFVVKLSRETGFADIGLRVCKNQKTSSYEDFAECVRTQEESVSQHSAGETSSSIYVKQSDKDMYCESCLYVISIKGEDTETHGFLNVLLQQDFTWLQEGRQLIDSVSVGQVNLYRLSVDSDEETYVSLQSYTGELEVRYSYRYSYDLTTYEGPFQINPNDKFIHLTLRPRQSMIDDDDSFHPFNKPKLNKVKAGDEKLMKSSVNDTSVEKNYAYIEDLSEYFFETEIFIAVVNKRQDIPSNYSIVFNGGDQYRYIYDGKIMGSSIPPEKKITYLYHYFENDAPARLNIFSHSKNFQIDSLEVTGFHDLMKNRRDYRDVTRDPIVLEKIASHDYFVSYSLPERNGTYELVFLNDHPTKTLNLSVSVNARDILLIPLTQRIEHALGPRSINYYEVIAPAKGYITLTTTHCAGEFEIGGSQDYDSFLEKEYSWTLKSFPGSSHVDTFKVKPGPVYFSITTDLEESFYKLRPDFFLYQKSIPHDKIVAGDEGVLTHQRSVGGKTLISFKPVTCPNCTSDILSKARVQYDIVYSTDLEILNVFGKCGSNNYFEHEAKTQLNFHARVDPQSIMGEKYKSKTFSMGLEATQTISMEIDLENDKVVYFASVVATISNIPNSQYRDLVVFYENSEIEVANHHRQASLYAFIFACILVIIFFLMTTCLFWRRYKNLQKGLEVTMKWRDAEMDQEKKKQQQEDEFQQQQNLDTSTNQSFGHQSIELLSSEHDLTDPSNKNKAGTYFPQQQLTERNKNADDENPFDKIQIKIAPPPQQKGDKQTKQAAGRSAGGYDQLVEEDD